MRQGLSFRHVSMATEISNGKQTVKLYHSVNRGKAMYQLAYYTAGRRVQKNFADKSEAKRVAKQILGDLSNDADAIEAMATPELESLLAARRVLAPGFALHLAVEEHAQAVSKLGKAATLREAAPARRHRAPRPRCGGCVTRRQARSHSQRSRRARLHGELSQEQGLASRRTLGRRHREFRRHIGMEQGEGLRQDHRPVRGAAGGGFEVAAGGP